MPPSFSTRTRIGLPALEKAIAALRTLTRPDFDELKAVPQKTIPEAVRNVATAVLCLMARDEAEMTAARDWKAAIQKLSEADKLVQDLSAFKEMIDAEKVPAANFEAARAYLAKIEHCRNNGKSFFKVPKGFDEEPQTGAESAAAGLCEWVINITLYRDTVCDAAEPLANTYMEGFVPPYTPTPRGWFKDVLNLAPKKTAPQADEEDGMVAAITESIREQTRRSRNISNEGTPPGISQEGRRQRHAAQETLRMLHVDAQRAGGRF